MAQIFSFLRLKDSERVGAIEKIYIKAFPYENLGVPLQKGGGSLPRMVFQVFGAVTLSAA